MQHVLKNECDLAFWDVVFFFQLIGIDFACLRISFLVKFTYLQMSICIFVNFFLFLLEFCIDLHVLNISFLINSAAPVVLMHKNALSSSHWTFYYMRKKCTTGKCCSEHAKVRAFNGSKVVDVISDARWTMISSTIAAHILLQKGKTRFTSATIFWLLFDSLLTHSVIVGGGAEVRNALDSVECGWCTRYSDSNLHIIKCIHSLVSRRSVKNSSADCYVMK